MAETKVVLFKRVNDTPNPVRVTADAPGVWPGYDDEEAQIFINTHFQKESDCWDCIISNAKSRLSLAADNLTTAEKKVRESEEECGIASVNFVLATRNHKKWVEAELLSSPAAPSTEESK